MQQKEYPDEYLDVLKYNTALNYCSECDKFLKEFLGLKEFKDETNK